MPLSFRRSYKKLPAADLNRNKRRIAKAPVKKATVQIPAEFRARRYPAVIPAGCGLGIGLCLFVLISQGYLRLPSIQSPAGTGVGDLAPASTATSPAEQRSATPVPRDTATFTPMPTDTVAPSATSAVASLNPWAADVPDAACIPADLPQTGRVVEVLDGDTIKVLMDRDGRVYSVRYLGIDAPALREGLADSGPEALARNSELVYRKQVLMVRDITDSDVNGTLLRYVLAEGVFVNHALVQAGLARVEMAAPDVACLSALLGAQQGAQSLARGLWSVTLTPTTMP